MICGVAGRSWRSVLLGAAAMVALVPAAQALTINGSYALSGDAWSGPRLTIETSTNGGSFAFDLDLGESATVNLFHIWTDDKKLNAQERIAKTMLAALSVGGGGSATITGATVGAGTLFQYGQVTWGGPVDISFGNGGVLRFSLSDETFNAGILGLTRGSAYGSDVTLTATYLIAPVPLPAGGALMLAGVGALAGLRRKRRTRQGA